MKKTDTMKTFRAMDTAGLTSELIKLRREQFSLRMQAASGQTVKPSSFGRARKNVARVKTLQKQMAGAKK
jgi:large subunit ribosomal protein L29